jgi:hypothetical protein
MLIPYTPNSVMILRLCVSFKLLTLQNPKLVDIAKKITEREAMDSQQQEELDHN